MVNVNLLAKVSIRPRFTRECSINPRNQCHESNESQIDGDSLHFKYREYRSSTSHSRPQLYKLYSSMKLHTFKQLMDIVQLITLGVSAQTVLIWYLDLDPAEIHFNRLSTYKTRQVSGTKITMIICSYSDNEGGRGEASQSAMKLFPIWSPDLPWSVPFYPIPFNKVSKGVSGQLRISDTLFTIYYYRMGRWLIGLWLGYPSTLSVYYKILQF